MIKITLKKFKNKDGRPITKQLKLKIQNKNKLTIQSEYGRQKSEIV